MLGAAEGKHRAGGGGRESGVLGVGVGGGAGTGGVLLPFISFLFDLDANKTADPTRPGVCLSLETWQMLCPHRQIFTERLLCSRQECTGQGRAGQGCVLQQTDRVSALTELACFRKAQHKCLVWHVAQCASGTAKPVGTSTGAVTWPGSASRHLPPRPQPQVCPRAF